MKITLVNGNYKPAWGCGGPARLMYELATYFSRNWSVSVVTSNYSGAAEPLAAGLTVEDGIRVHRLPMNAPGMPFFPAAAVWPAGLARTLRAELRQSDAAIVFNTRSSFSIAASLLCRRLGVPYGVAALGSLPGGAARINRLVRRLIDPAIVHRNCRQARYCVAQNNNEAEEYRRIGVASGTIRLIPLGSDSDRFNPLPGRGAFRSRLGIPLSDPLALFVGRLHVLKGLDTLIGAAAIVRSRIPNFKLALVGKDYGDEQRLRDIVRNNGMQDTVLFSGPLYEERAVEAYTDADVYTIAPRHFEETSLASIEAAFCGTPLVFTREAEAPFFDTQGGGLCVRNSPEAVAEGVMAVISSPAKLSEMSARARRIACEYYAMSSIGHRYEEAFGLS